MRMCVVEYVLAWWWCNGVSRCNDVSRCHGASRCDGASRCTGMTRVLPVPPCEKKTGGKQE
jgi:hypothetical protein